MGPLGGASARARLATLALVLLGAACDDGGSREPDAAADCPQCCYCACVDIGTIRIDVAGEPGRCLDCQRDCADICSRYGTGEMTSAEPCGEGVGDAGPDGGDQGDQK